MSKETLKQAAEQFEYTDGIYGFKQGAKWQAERMYSEEEVLDLLHRRNFDLKHKKDTKTTKEWFEQFKK